MARVKTADLAYLLLDHRLLRLGMIGRIKIITSKCALISSTRDNQITLIYIPYTRGISATEIKKRVIDANEKNKKIAIVLWASQNL